MASNGSVNTTEESAATVMAPPSGSPKGMVCLCSPTTHPGSFRCRFHRAQSSNTAWMKRSNSMPVRKGASSNSPSSSSSSSVTSLSPKSVETT